MGVARLRGLTLGMVLVALAPVTFVVVGVILSITGKADWDNEFRRWVPGLRFGTTVIAVAGMICVIVAMWSRMRSSGRRAWSLWMTTVGALGLVSGQIVFQLAPCVCAIAWHTVWISFVMSLFALSHLMTELMQAIQSRRSARLARFAEWNVAGVSALNVGAWLIFPTPDPPMDLGDVIILFGMLWGLVVFLGFCVVATVVACRLITLLRRGARVGRGPLQLELNAR